MIDQQKKILFITAYPPNKLTAGQSNTTTVINDVKAINYQVHLITFSYPGHEIEKPERFGYIKQINANRPYKYLYALFFFMFFPLYTVRFSFRTFLYLLQNQSKYTFIYLDYSQVFLYALFIRKKEKIFLMTHDLVIQRFTRAYKKGWYKKLICGYVFFSEKFFFSRAKHIILPSFKDKRVAEHIYHIKGMAILPKNRFKISFADKQIPDLKKFVFLGTWNRQENLQGLNWFIKNVYPLLPTGIEFIIIGGSLPESFKNTLPPSFKATGFIDDFSPCLQNASALISPLFQGAGIKFKVLDALSNGCRVIGTHISFEGIRLNKQNIILQAQTAEEFAKAIRFCTEHTYDAAEIKTEFGQYINNYVSFSEMIE